MAAQKKYRKPNPLVEVFGHPVDNFSPRAEHFRKNRLCPYSNKVPNCTKPRWNDPIGVCSLFDGHTPTIICPVRFQQDWHITADASGFFFPQGTKWTCLAEVRLKDTNGNSAGNVDFILVSYDDDGQVVDFGAVEVQSVYISGNVSNPFKHYIQNPMTHYDMDWTAHSKYPRPDYLSSTRKRLAPQLICKGKILHYWGKKIAVAVHSALFNTLPQLPEVDSAEADIAWLIYELAHDSQQNLYRLVLSRTVYTRFEPALDKITTPIPGNIDSFVGVMQKKLNEELDKLELTLPENNLDLDLFQL